MEACTRDPLWKRGNNDTILAVEKEAVVFARVAFDFDEAGTYPYASAIIIFFPQITGFWRLNR